MARKADLFTPAQRIAWAIENSGMTLVALAQDIGCSHAALSQWATARTEADNIKAAGNGSVCRRVCNSTRLDV